MAIPQVVAVQPDSPAHRAGVVVGDALSLINGEQPRDVIRYQLLVDEPEISLEIERGGLTRTVDISKRDGEPLGIEVQSAVFDQIRTCDNHCSFCFIYQLPPGMRKSLSLKDDDYRLSFLYGNFTTLTRFTEADLERVITERLSPLYVSIHATDRQKRSELLRNRRGATSLRWLRALLDAEVEVHGQVVVCPGVNDGAVLADTMLGVLDEYPELVSLAVVPLGVSDHSNEPEMRFHTEAEAAAVIDVVEEWQQIFLDQLDRRLVYAADEYYLLAGRPFPDAENYEGFAMHEDGIGMARTFELEFNGEADQAVTPAAGFFSWVDGAPAEGYRAARLSSEVDEAFSVSGSVAVSGPATSSSATSTVPAAGVTAAGDVSASAAQPVVLRRSKPTAPAADSPIGILTGAYGAKVLGPLVESVDRDDVRVIPVDNKFFGGNIGVTGLMVGEDVARHLDQQPAGHRYLLPDVCLSGGLFLDGTSPEDLPRPVEIVSTDGISLKEALEVGR